MEEVYFGSLGEWQEFPGAEEGSAGEPRQYSVNMDEIQPSPYLLTPLIVVFFVLRGESRAGGEGPGWPWGSFELYL